MLTGLADWPAAHAALLMAFLQETVLAVGWLVVAALQRELRRAAWHWAGFALLSGVSFIAYVAAAHLQQDQLRLVGNLQLVLAMLLQCRGLYLFAGRRPLDVVSVAVAVATGFVLFVWSSNEDAPWRIAAVSVLAAGCSAWAAATVVRIARGFTDARWIPVLFAAPMALGGLVLAVRGVGALVTPEAMVAATAAGDSIPMSMAIYWLLLSLSFELSLVGLVIVRLVGQLRHTARHDALTGVLNRRAVEEILLQETARAVRSGRGFAVAMIDLDHFKQINDRFGHAAGDEVLQSIASALHARLRATDALARWGGEEFLVLLPGTGIEDAVRVAEQLRGVAADTPLLRDGETVRLTLCVGVAIWAGEADPSMVVDRADDALYRAKREGRDRVCVADAPDLARQRPAPGAMTA